jgi:homoserine dehydrogenase
MRPTANQDSGPSHSAPAEPATIRVGMLGLGGVNQAAARLCETAADALATHGLRLRVTHALVRDVNRQRAYRPPEVALTADPETFLTGHHDLVIEALGGPEPAGTYVRRVLETGTPVVTANKSMVAARGEELFAVAAEHGTALLCEAAVIAGMPFLTLLNNRPLAARVDRLVGIVNGTTNYILSAMEQQRVPFDVALRSAQELGYAEPDPTFDIRAIDPAEKLVILLQHIGVRGVRVADLEVTGITDITVADVLQARELGGVIKLIAYAAFVGSTLEAYVGPTLVPANDPLASLSREQNGIRLMGPEIGRLFYSGPGAGPEVTASTLLDDAVEVLTKGPASIRRLAAAGRGKPSACRAPETPWMLRLRFPRGAPTGSELSEFLGAQGIWFRQLTDVRHGDAGDVKYAVTYTASRDRLNAALGALHAATGCEAYPIRVLEA